MKELVGLEGISFSMSKVVGNSDMTIRLLDREFVEDGEIYTWKVNVFDPFESNITLKGKQRVRARSLARAGLGSTVSGIVAHRNLIKRLTNIQEEELIDSADFTSIYEYKVKVITGGSDD